MLPTIEQAQAALALMNKGREAIGMQPVEYLDFDAAVPNTSGYCLSAKTVFGPAGFSVLTDTVIASRPQVQYGIVEAMGLTQPPDAEDDEREYRIPETILAVTDPFDRLSCRDGDDYQSARSALRERLVEAGVVKA